ncbi:MAG TPA: tetratricopeptide repeat protein [Bryobacteraceae bacterium]|nr:tetratricopeptide repeat protein [Bryobacteraceae bacterium]
MLLAQIANSPHSVHDIDSFDGDAQMYGRIDLPPGMRAFGLEVELWNTSGQTAVATTTPSGNGDFSFRDTPHGQFLLRVRNDNGDVLAEQLVNTAMGIGIRVRLPEQSQERPINGTVSLAELSHKVPGKAKHELDLAGKALRKKDMHGGIEHLEKTLAIDPDYLAARRDLGLLYLKTGQNEKAIDEFQKVLMAEPHSSVACSAMTSAYFDMKRYSDAEAAARRTLEIESGNTVGHLLLGLSLAEQNKDDSEALTHLKIAEERFPQAHMAAATILLRQGHEDLAKRQMRAYLNSGGSTVREQAEKWYAALR